MPRWDATCILPPFVRGGSGGRASGKTRECVRPFDWSRSFNPDRGCAAKPRVDRRRRATLGLRPTSCEPCKGFCRTSIPDVSLIEIDSVFPEQSPELVLERFFPMVGGKSGS